MGISVSSVENFGVVGDHKQVTVLLDITSYNNGGESVTASDIPHLSLRIDWANIHGASDNGHFWEWDQSNGQITVNEPTGGHTHVAFTVNDSETASDQTNFVSITEGDGTAQTSFVVGAAGGGSDTDITTDSVSGSGSELADSQDAGEALITFRGK